MGRREELRSMQEAWRAYLDLALGFTEASRKRAMKVAKKLVGRGGATAEQLQSMAEDLVSTSAANRESLVRLVRFELDRALGRVGLATAEEVSQLTTRVRELEEELRLARAGTGPAVVTVADDELAASAAPVRRGPRPPRWSARRWRRRRSPAPTAPHRRRPHRPRRPPPRRHGARQGRAAGQGDPRPRGPTARNGGQGAPSKAVAKKTAARRRQTAPPRRPVATRPRSASRPSADQGRGRRTTADPPAAEPSREAWPPEPDGHPGAAGPARASGRPDRPDTRPSTRPSRAWPSRPSCRPPSRSPGTRRPSGRCTRHWQASTRADGSADPARRRAGPPRAGPLAGAGRRADRGGPGRGTRRRSRARRPRWSTRPTRCG